MFTRNTIKSPAEHDSVVNRSSSGSVMCNNWLLVKILAAGLNVCVLYFCLEHDPKLMLELMKSRPAP